MTITSVSNTTLIDTEQIDLQCTGNGYPMPFVQVNILIVTANIIFSITSYTDNKLHYIYIVGVE